MKTSVGFTLIELLLVIAVGAILFTVGLARYNDFNRRQTLKQAAFNLKNDLQSAKTKAFAGNKSGCTTLDRYRVSFTANNYSIAAVCVGGSLGTETIVPLPAGVTFSPLVGSPLEFKILGKGVETAQNIYLTGSNLYYQVSVSVTGEIQDGGFVSAPSHTCPGNCADGCCSGTTCLYPPPGNHCGPYGGNCLFCPSGQTCIAGTCKTGP